MQKRRLLKLVNLLRENARNNKGAKFDLAVWGKFEGETPSISCNTTGCAAGLAAMSGVFKRAGLRYKVIPLISYPYTSSSLAKILGGKIEIRLKGYRHRNSKLTDSYGAVLKFFGLKNEEGEYLFLGSHYEDDGLPTQGADGERAVAKRIQAFVKRGGLPKRRQQKEAYHDGL